MNYCITVHDEVIEFGRLIKYLSDHKLKEDKIFVIHDKTNVLDKTVEDIFDIVSEYDVTLYEEVPLEGNFAKFKNAFAEIVPEGEYIFQLDADELISPELIVSIQSIVDANKPDLLFFPRLNRVEGITEEYIRSQRWIMDEDGYINYPDKQGRCYRNLPDIQWEGKVHERIVGAKNITSIPNHMKRFAIIHNKTFTKQKQQNELYSKL